MNKTLIPALVATAAAVALAAPAHAGVLTAVTTVDWGGTTCLNYRTASMEDHYEESGVGTQCSSGRELTFTDSAVPGQYVGVDPIMGDNDWITCTISINGGVHVYTSYAARGDGNDVNCLRVVD